ncbi:MAG TPA: MFS transporter [Ilumatobacteraceae bacterium]
MSNHPFRPLRRRSVLLVWGAGVMSDAGTWIQLVVVGALVASTTGSALQTGLIALATFMPQGFASPIGGLLADRFDRGRVFVAGLTGQAIATMVLAILLANGVRHTVPLAGLIMLASTFGNIGAPAYAAMLPDMVPPEELLAMSSLTIYSWNAGRIVGPIIGTILARTAGPAWTVGVNAISFACLAVAVLALRRKFVPHDTRPGTIAERLREGGSTARRIRACVFGISCIAILNFAVSPFMGLIPAYATKVFHGGVGLVGLFSSIQGVGAITGTMLVTTLGLRFGRARVMRVVFVMLIVAYVMYALAPTAVFAGVSIFFLGAGAASSLTTMTYIVQRDAPHAQRGRIMSILQALSGFGYGVGLVIFGALGDGIGLRVALLCSASTCLLLTLYVTHRLWYWRHALDHAQLQPEPIRPRLYPVEVATACD